MGSREQQRGRRDRFIVIPFSSTCRSAASVDIVQSKKPQGAGGGGEGTSAAAVRPAKGESLSLVARLLRGFKNLSHQIFAVYDEDDEEEEPEMVIGLPTDVKHVAHIGWDGSTSTTSSVRSWNRAAPPPGTTAPAAASASTSASASSSSAAPPPPQAQPPSLSARQFELAMAAQASAAATTSTSGAARRHRHYS
ncbi:CRIB domain-containing protein RIC4-like [Hordeum vulgare]|nr:CRIB domain-containing protein RIC4-like [Hordeum vulgare]